MTIQTLFDAWKASGAYTSIEASATDAEIQAARGKNRGDAASALA